MTGGGPTIWETRPTRAAFAGDSITVFAAFDCRVPDQAIATLRFAGGETLEQMVSLRPALEVADSVLRLAAHARMSDLAPEERSAWALRHQLVTDATDYLITVERAEGEKADGVPALQVVPQMLAAGWGATSSVAGGIMAACCCVALPGAGGFADTFGDIFGGGRGQYGFDHPEKLPPSVLRNSRRMTAVQHPLDKLIRNLNQHGPSRFGRSMPKGLDRLKKWGLPDTFSTVFEAAVRSGQTEELVFWAFLSALAAHPSGSALDGGFRKWLGRCLAGLALPEDTLSAFNAELDALPPLPAGTGLADRYDIPAFLRKVGI